MIQLLQTDVQTEYNVTAVLSNDLLVRDDANMNQKLIGVPVNIVTFRAVGVVQASAQDIFLPEK